MAEFEELKLSVNFTDNASAGLASVRKEIDAIKESAGGVSSAFSTMAAGAQRFGDAARTAAPHVRGVQDNMKALTKSAEETGRGLMQMALSVRGGVSALPQLALGLREASTGFSGLQAAMALVAPEAAAAITALVGVGIAVTAVGVAVTLYGVAVFKFAQEMNKLNMAAKELGIGLQTLKNLTDEGARFGHSSEQVIQGLNGISEAMGDLSHNNSQLRRSLLSEGVNAQFIDQLARQNDPRVVRNMVRQYGLMVKQERMRQGSSELAATNDMNSLGRKFGQDPSIFTERAVPPPDPARAQQFEFIAEKSTAISEVWADIKETLSSISLDVLTVGLPIVNVALEGIWVVAKAIEAAFVGIRAAFYGIKGIAQFVSGDFKGAWQSGKNAVGAVTGYASSVGEHINRSLGPGGEQAAPQGMAAQEDIPEALKRAPAAAPPGSQPAPLARGPIIPPAATAVGSVNLGATAANDNARALQAATTTLDLTDETTKNTLSLDKLTRQIELLISNWFGGTGGAGVGGGGGAHPSYGLGQGGAAGAGDGGGGNGLGGGGGSGGGGGASSSYPANGGGNAAGGAGLPSSGTGAAAAGVPGAGAGHAQSGSLAEQRAGFQKELDADPELKSTVIGAMQHEGGIKSNMEQLMNMAAMRHQTIRQALYSGQYGPVTGRNRIPNIGNISAKTRAEGEAALKDVYAGSNITDYATDQGMKGDPNYDKYQSNPAYWGMHKVEGAWFSAHGEPGRKWAAEQRARDAASAAANQTASPNQSARVEGAGAPGAGPTPGQDPGKIPFREQGTLTMEDKVYHYASGGAGRGATPPGSYPINIGKGDIGSIGQRIGSVATIGGLGGTYNDPRYPGAPRGGVQIHPGSATSDHLDRLMTQGCFGIAKDEWPAYKAHLLDLNARTPGGLRIDVGKDGKAQILARGAKVPLPGQNPTQGATPANVAGGGGLEPASHDQAAGGLSGPIMSDIDSYGSGGYGSASHGQAASGMTGPMMSDLDQGRKQIDEASGAGGVQKHEGSLNVRVSGTPSEVDYNGTGLLRQTSFERSSEGQLTKTGPRADDSMAA